MNATGEEGLACEAETAVGNVTNSTVIMKWERLFVSDRNGIALLLQ
jgi:hypothetical protein